MAKCPYIYAIKLSNATNDTQDPVNMDPIVVPCDLIKKVPKKGAVPANKTAPILYATPNILVLVRGSCNNSSMYQ